MKHIRRFLQILACVMVLSVLTPSTIPFRESAVAQAASVKLNKKTLTLEVGKSTTLKISGTTAKVTWSSSDKAVATVNSKGKVTAKKAGKATITATVSKKKYTCTVTVKKAASQAVKKETAATQSATLGNYKFEYPKDWTNKVIQGEGSELLALLQPGKEEPTTESYGIAIMIAATGMPKPDLNLVKALLESPDTREYFAELFGLESGKDITKLTVNEFKATPGTALQVDFEVTAEEKKALTRKERVYALFIDKDIFVLRIPDLKDDEKLKLTQTAEAIVNSLTMVK